MAQHSSSLLRRQDVNTNSRHFTVQVSLRATSLLNRRRLSACSAGKETTTGHWELMGLVLEQAFATFKAFPADLVDELERRGGVRFLGNFAASGTEILHQLGEKHLQTGSSLRS